MKVYLGVSAHLDLSTDRECCEDLIGSAQSTFNILQQAECHIFWAKLASLECEAMEGLGVATAERFEQLKKSADVHLDSARDLCAEFLGQTASVAGEIDDIRRSLREAGYQSQMRMVVAAMEKEFSDTGSWYRC